MDSDSPHAQPGQSGATGGADHIQVGRIEGSQAVAIGRGATAVYQGLTVAEVAALMVELKRRDQPKVWDGRIPYPGLQAYQESDARFFFGREKLAADLLARVQQASFITIAGPSGSGKSSAARAGLLHALREGCVPKSDRWLLATMQPGGEPAHGRNLHQNLQDKRPLPAPPLTNATASLRPCSDRLRVLPAQRWDNLRNRKTQTSLGKIG
jgi:hypothetical protein